MTNLLLSQTGAGEGEGERSESDPILQILLVPGYSVLSASL